MTLEIRQLLGVVLSLALVAPVLQPLPLQAQTPSAGSRNTGNNWGWFQDSFRQPYAWRDVAPINLTNSARIEQLIRAGKLYLSLQDAVALALENNLDIELQRYGPRISEQDFRRAEAGGAARAPATQVSNASAAAAGNQPLAGNAQTQTGNTLNVQSFDPVFTTNYQFGQTSQPLTNTFINGTSSLQSRRTVLNSSIQKAFISGTSISLGFNNNFVDQNSPRNDFNPSKTVNADLQITQRLLQGFGVAVNNRNIRIAKNNMKVSDLVFKQQVITTVAGVIASYWDLVAANEDLAVKRQALRLNEKLYEDNKKQVEIGTLAPIEIIRAEAEVARSQQELTISETTLLQQETTLKNALSRTGVSNPALAEARIVPTDRIRIPENEPIEPIQDLVSRALENRPELEQNKISLENAKIGLVGTRNAMKPTVDAFVDLRNNGLSGLVNTQTLPPSLTGGFTVVRDPNSVDRFFLGGYGTAFSQVLRRNFPDYTMGVTLNIPLRNRAAQADMVREQLSVRQNEVRLQQQYNQVRVDVQNALIGLQQARARYLTAQKNRVLQEQTLDAEQKKYALGASTIFFVIQAQRDLTQAQASEVAALSTYARARNELERSTGMTLKANSIDLDEAVKGQVSRPAAILPPVQ